MHRWRTTLSVTILLALCLLTITGSPSALAAGSTLYLPCVTDRVTPVIPDTTTVIDADDGGLLTDISPDQSTLTFQAGASCVDGLATGDVLVSGPTSVAPEGLLRRVTSIEQGGGSVTLQTEEATLEDAIEDGAIHAQGTLSLSEVTQPQLVPGASLVATEADDPHFFVQIADLAIHDADGDASTTDDRLTVTGDVDLTPSYTLDMRIVGHRMIAFTFLVTLNETAELTVDGDAQTPVLEYEHSLLAQPYTFKPAVIWVGSVPVVIVPTLDLVLSVEGSTTVDLSATVTQQAAVTAGATYAAGAWTPVGDLDHSFAYQSPLIAAGGQVGANEAYSIDLKAGVGPDLAYRLYGVAGPSLSAKPYLRLVAESPGDPAWSLYGGFEVPVAISIKVLGQCVAGYQRTVIDTSRLLAQAESQPTPTPSPSPTPAPNAGWIEVGTGSATGEGVSASNDCSWPTLAAAPDGSIYVTWAAGQRYQVVRRWNGSTWEAVGDAISDGAIASNRASLAIGHDNRPIIAWTVDTDSAISQVYVRLWDGYAWREIGAGSATGAGISDNQAPCGIPSIAVSCDGAVFVAWHVYTGGDAEVYVRRWNGSNWAEVGKDSASAGGISRNDGLSFAPSMAISPNGTPYVAWHDDSNGNFEIYVRRWDGSAWREIGTGSATGGGISSTSGYSYDPSLAFGPDGTPYVAWEDNTSGTWQICVRKWDGSAWREVGLGSATGVGISNTPDASWGLSLAVRPDGSPCVAWRDKPAGICQIYVRCWTGSAWAEMGSGSASGGGISRNAGTSAYPSLAIDSAGHPIVAWVDDTSGDDEIYVRRWSGSN